MNEKPYNQEIIINSAGQFLALYTRKDGSMFIGAGDESDEAYVELSKEKAKIVGQRLLDYAG